MGQQGGKIQSVLGGHLRIEDSNDRLLVSDDSNNDILILGKDPNGNIVVKIAKAGFDVKTAADANLIFNSNQNVFKIAKKISGNFSFTTLAGGMTSFLTLTHNLGYVPLHTSFASNVVLNPYLTSPTTVQVPYFILASSSGVGGLIVQAAINFQSADTTTLTYKVEIYTSAGNTCSGTITAYVLQETAS